MGVVGGCPLLLYFFFSFYMWGGGGSDLPRRLFWCYLLNSKANLILRLSCDFCNVWMHTFNFIGIKNPNLIVSGGGSSSPSSIAKCIKRYFIWFYFIVATDVTRVCRFWNGGRWVPFQQPHTLVTSLIAWKKGPFYDNFCRPQLLHFWAILLPY